MSEAEFGALTIERINELLPGLRLAETLLRMEGFGKSARVVQVQINVLEVRLAELHAAQ